MPGLQQHLDSSIRHRASKRAPGQGCAARRRRCIKCFRRAIRGRSLRHERDPRSTPLGAHRRDMDHSADRHRGLDGRARLVSVAPAAVGPQDRTLGSANAKVTLIMYEDFQCPWCGKFVTESETQIRNTYVANGQVQLVFRDFPFLGSFVQPYVAAKDESINAAMAARCAGDQGKFWDYHDYLFSHQTQENTGDFSVANLKSFAQKIGLDTTSFNQCLDSGKYAAAVAASKAEGTTAGVNGTPKGFILVKGKVVDTIDGYLPVASVTAKLDAALKD